MKFKNKKFLINLIIAITITIVLIIIDQITKLIVVRNIDENEVIPVIKGFINFRLVYNTGFAFGLGEGGQTILAIVSIIGCLIIGYFYKKIDFKKELFFSIIIIMLMAGTFGNMIDRLFSSKGVIDFIEPAFINFAIFNIADSLLTVGSILLVIYLLFVYKEPHEKKPEQANDEIKIDELPDQASSNKEGETND